MGDIILGLKTHIQNYPGKIGEAAGDMHVFNFGLHSLIQIRLQNHLEYESISLSSHHSEFQHCH